MATHTTLTSLFDAIADAIRAKKGTEDQIVADNFPDEIASIQTQPSGFGGEYNVVSIDNGDGTQDIRITDAEGATSIVPLSVTTNGTYEAGAGIAYSPVIVDVEVPTITLQSKSVSPTTSTQTITADDGYGGLSEVEIGAISPTKAAQTYTPKTYNQTISGGQWLTGAQTIRGDSNLTSENIRNGVSIFGIQGEFPKVCQITVENNDTDDIRVYYHEYYNDEIIDTFDNVPAETTKTLNVVYDGRFDIRYRTSSICKSWLVDIEDNDYLGFESYKKSSGLYIQKGSWASNYAPSFTINIIGGIKGFDE